MIKIFKYMKSREWLMILISVGIMLFQTWLDLLLPDYMKQITINLQTPGSSILDIWGSGIRMLVATLGSAATTVALGYLGARIAAKFSQRLRSAMFNKVQTFSMEEINGFSTASLITRSTNDITQLQMFVVMSIQMIIRAPIMAVWALLKISSGSWKWTALTGVAVVLLMIMLLSIMSYAVKRFRKIQLLTDNLNAITRENLSGIRVVRAYNAEKYQEAKFAKANDAVTKNQLETNRAFSLMAPGMNLINSGLTLGIYWLGAYLLNEAVMADKTTVFANMIAFSSYVGIVISAFMMLTMLFMQLPRVMVSVRRVNEVLDTEPKIIDGKMTGSPDGHAGEVEFRNVSFKYPDAEEYVLKDISFTVNKGETVAFIGSTGSGKSTLINLVPRFYDVTEGQLLLDGVDVRDYTQEALRAKLGYVPQRAMLFSGTVASNVGYGDNGRGQATEEDVKNAVAIAQSTDFVEALDDQYGAHIAQGGTNLSGGQKQRLAIARAICRKPEVYIFDDSFSALDYRTDRVLRTALKKETSGVTSLIVAQRIGTIREADKIVVLEEGKMVGIGTHDELMKSCEVYQEIAFSQLSKEELGV